MSYYYFTFERENLNSASSLQKELNSIQKELERRYHGTEFVQMIGNLHDKAYLIFKIDD